MSFLDLDPPYLPTMRIHTIGDLIEYRYSRAVHCTAPGCHNHKQLDLQAVGEWLVSITNT